MKKYFNYISNRLIVLFGISFFFTNIILVLTIFLRKNEYFIYFIFFSLTFYLVIFIISLKYIYFPYNENKKILKIFVDGYTNQDIFDTIFHISPEFESLIEKLKEIFNKHELINTTKKHAQYLALQNQINPHFLYNTLEGIRSEALIAKLYTVSDMTEALGNFFRYTISNKEHLVNLEDELINVENYFFIQQYRFGERISLNINYNDNSKEVILKNKIPKLTLQPIIENAIYHGIERKINKGTLKISFETTQKNILITVSDDGVGMKKEELEKLLKKINLNSFENYNQVYEETRGIALVNVNNRIKLIFGETYGLNIFSTINVGTDVEILLPLIS